MPEIGFCVDGVRRERVDDGTGAEREFLYCFTYPLRVRTVSRSAITDELKVTFTGSCVDVSIPKRGRFFSYEESRKTFLDTLNGMINTNYSRQYGDVPSSTEETENGVISRLDVMHCLSFEETAYDVIEVETSILPDDVVSCAGTKISGICGNESRTLFEEPLMTSVQTSHTAALRLLEDIYRSILRKGINPSVDANYRRFVEAEGCVWLK